MKHLLVKASLPVALLMAGIGTEDAQAGQFRLDSRTPLARSIQKVQPVREYRGERPWSENGRELNERLNARMKNGRKVAPNDSYRDLLSYSFIEGPDGTVWFYTADYEYDGRDIKSFTFNIYDSSFELQGTVHDVVTLAEGETRAALIDIDPAVSTKFFNSDSRPEVMVAFAMNTGEEYDYEVHYYNKVYSLGGQKDGDNDVSLMTMPGRCVDAINVAADRWSEDFVYTFVEDIQPDPSLDYEDYMEFLGGYYFRLNTYRKGGYSGGPSLLMSHDVPRLNVPGDNNDGIYFISKVHGGRPYFIYSQYEKSFLVDPTGFAQDESATPDNNLVIDVYSWPNNYAKELTHESTTKIPSIQIGSEDDPSYTFYGIGTLAWDSDVDMSVNGTPSAPAFIVTRDYVRLRDVDNYISSYYVYDNSGKAQLTLGEETDGVLLMSDIEGCQPQAMFVNADTKSYLFSFVDLYSGETVLQLDQAINGEAMQAIGDRVPAADGYKYAFMLSYGDEDKDGNYFPRVAWISKEGELERIDRINTGKNVLRASINMAQSVLNPYLYDTDSAMEYAVLVGRSVTGSSKISQEFLVVKANTEAYGPMIEFNGNSDLGSVYSFSLVRGTDMDRLHIAYLENGGAYNVDVYELPLKSMDGGDGTAGNPYLIGSIADMQQIKRYPSACYKLNRDIDGSDFDFVPVKNFTGTLDGNGKTISNLRLNSSNYNVGLFDGIASGAKVSNLRFVDPVIIAGEGNSTLGLVAGTAMDAHLSDIHVYGLTASGNGFEGSFGGLVGQATVKSTISGCSMIDADINLPSAGLIGGIVGSARTGIAVSASSFTGRIAGASNLGGIAGETITGDETFTDLHVDADISGENTIGGIIGSSSRSFVKRCYVEGELRASVPGRWNKAYAVGGIVGSLAANYSDTAKDIIISNNLVALNRISWPAGEIVEDYAGQTATQHRIVGRSQVNTEPEVIDYDAEDNPVYGEPAGPELYLADNYAWNLNPADPTLVGANTTEGADVENIDREFLVEVLGMSFGTTVDAPWHVYSDTDPWLHHEASYIVANPAVKAVEGETFNISLRFFGAEKKTIDDVMGDFMADWDAEAIEMTGNATMDNNVMAIEFKALKTGVFPVVFDIRGQRATATVEVAPAVGAGITDVVAPAASVISFDGVSVKAAGHAITIFTTTGIRVASGDDSIAVDHLGAGVYVVVAADAAGNRSTLKIVK